MATKDELLALLEMKRGVYVSGEEIASSLAVSRAAVWKAVEALRREGYPIEAVRHKGYCLSEESDLISKAGILKYLSEDSKTKSLVSLDVEQEVTSTNDILKEKAAAGAPDGTVIVASAQTAGKGRAGRSFYSPDDSGVYLSILLRPEGFTAERAARFTTMAAIAACHAIDELTGSADMDVHGAQIKWVNDVYLAGKKVVGILTEAGLDLESGALDYAVLGIGFNVYEPEGGFPEEIRERAGAILTERIGGAKNRLIAAFIRQFICYYREEIERKDDGQLPAYVHAYQERCFVVGREIDVIAGGQSRPARALSVDDDCRLLVEYGDGTRETLASGEVSIRV